MVSILEQIAENVLQAIEGVNASVNGVPKYTYQLSGGVYRASAATMSPKPFSAIIYQVPGSNREGPQFADTREQLFSVVVYVPVQEHDTIPVDTYNNELAAAIHYEVSRDVYRNGLAINTEVLPYIIFPAEAEEYAGVTLNIAVTYRTLIDNPFQGSSN